jgi:hypothetical protein
MVAWPLVETTITDASRLIDELDEAGFPIRAALWLYNAEVPLWRLVLASPQVDQLGPLEAYKRVQQILRTNTHQLRLSEISLLGPNAPLIEAIRTLLAGVADVSGRRLAGTGTNGVYIDDSYIYRLT